MWRFAVINTYISEQTIPTFFYDLPFHARFKLLLSVLLNIQVFWDITLSHWTLLKEFNVFIFSVKQSKNDTWWTAWTYDEDITILGSKSKYQLTNGNIGENFNLWPLLDLKTEVWYKICAYRWTGPVFQQETMNEFWMLCEVSSGHTFNQFSKKKKNLWALTAGQCTAHTWPIIPRIF